MEICEDNRRIKRVRFNEEVTSIIYDENVREDENEDILFPTSVKELDEDCRPGILRNSLDEDTANDFDENTSPLVFKILNRRAPKSPGKPLKFREVIQEDLQDLANKKLFISEDDDLLCPCTDSKLSSNS